MRVYVQSAGLGIRGAPLARAAPAALRPRRAARPHSVRMVTQELAEAMQQGVTAGLDPAAIHLAFADQVGPECPRTAASPPLRVSPRIRAQTYALQRAGQCTR